MDLVLCHTTADFDTLGAAVGLARLQPGVKIVLSGGSDPAVQDFLALYRDEYPLLEHRSVNPVQLRSLLVVDTQRRDRLGAAAPWLDQPQLNVTIYDHHPRAERDIAATQVYIEAVGATTTLVVEQLQAQQVQLTVAEATVMALGIHSDTGSLTYTNTTVRDAAALTWLMTQAASLSAIAQYINPGLSRSLQTLLSIALEQLQTEQVQGRSVAWVLLTTPDYIPGLSHLAAQLMTLTENDSLLVASRYRVETDGSGRLTIIGRSRTAEVDLNALLLPLGGGGHPQAAAVTLKTNNAGATLNQLLLQLKQQIPPPPTAQRLMSTPVRTIRPETTIEQAQQTLLRYGHSGLPVVNAGDRLVGIISRRDLDIALHHGFGHAPVKGYMSSPVKTIAPSTSLAEIEALMVSDDIGRLPVLVQDQLVGIVTRTDVLRQLHQLKQSSQLDFGVTQTPIQAQLEASLSPQLQTLLAQAAAHAQQRGWNLYLVGGAVRDLLLARPEAVALREFDLVVDGIDPDAAEAAGIELAQALQQTYPEAQLQIHGKFKTAALQWSKTSAVGTFEVDIATARTEFYPYPAANPEVEASSIRQDLYRRDFTINALAVRLTPGQASPNTERPTEGRAGNGKFQAGELLDFFKGLEDLKHKQIRVLHPNSFIEDPTRIFRAVRFAVRLGFGLNPRTEQYIRSAIASGIYDQIQAKTSKAPALQVRLRQELKYILQAPYWETALKWLADLTALECLHPNWKPRRSLWPELRLANRWFQCLGNFQQEAGVSRWEVLLEVLIIQLAPEYRAEVAQNLHLSANSVQRVQQLADVQAAIVRELAQDQRPSLVTRLLHQQDSLTLILTAAQSSLVIRRVIWSYLSDWAKRKPLLTGNDLKALGYLPGRHFKLILAALQAATLDGIVRDHPGAEAFLAQHYPLVKTS